jgi:hypothetical protein
VEEPILFDPAFEIPPAGLKEVINRNYSALRAPETMPLITLNENEHLYLLVLFHGPTFAFKDVALQELGNLFEHFLVRRNKGRLARISIISQPLVQQVVIPDLLLSTVCGERRMFRSSFCIPRAG